MGEKMDHYYNSKKIRAKGREVWASGKQPNVPAGQKLIAILWNGLRYVCPDVTEQSEYQTFYDAYYHGYWVKMSLFLVPTGELASCKD